MNRKIYIAMIFLIVGSMAVPTTAWEWTYDLDQVYVAWTRNAILDTVIYDGVERDLVFYIVERDDSWYNLGLASFEAVFNRSWAPPVNKINAYLIINGSTYDALDMIKNFTYVENAAYVQWDTWGNGTPWIRLCSYFQAYIYLWENQTIVNEQSIADLLMWDHTVFNENEVPNEEPLRSTQDTSIISTDVSVPAVADPSHLAVIADYGNPPMNIDMMPVVVAAVSGAVLGFIIIVMVAKLRE
jgi:hypothetical protein